MRDALRDLHPLTHPLAIDAYPAVSVLGQSHLGHRTGAPFRRLGRGEPVDPEEGPDQVVPRHPVEQRRGLRAVPDPATELPVTPGRLPEQGEPALVGPELAREQSKQGRLASAVRTDQTGDPLREGRTEPVQPEDLAVALRHGFGVDDPGHSPTTSIRARRHHASAASTTPTTIITTAEVYGLSGEEDDTPNAASAMVWVSVFGFA